MFRTFLAKPGDPQDLQERVAPKVLLLARWKPKALSRQRIGKRWKESTYAGSKKTSITSLRVIPAVTSYYNIFVTNSDILCVLKSGEDEEERIILMKSRALRSLDFIRIILSSSSILLVGGPAVTTVIYLAKLTQTNSRYAWFETNSDSRRPGVSRRLGASKRLGVSRRLSAWELRFERHKNVWQT